MAKKTATKAQSGSKRSVAIGTWPTPERPQAKGKKVAKPPAKRRTPGKRTADPRAIDTVPLPEKTALALKARRRELVRQLAKVRVEYPLVALAYYMSSAAARVLKDHLAEVSGRASTLDTYFTLESSIEAKLELTERIRKLERCLGRAKTDADTAGCFDRFAKS